MPTTLCRPELAGLKRRFGGQALMLLTDGPVIGIEFLARRLPRQNKITVPDQNA